MMSTAMKPGEESLGTSASSLLAHPCCQGGAMPRLHREARILFENDKLAAVQCAGGLQIGDTNLATVSTDGSRVAWARAAPGTSSLPAGCQVCGVALARPVPHKTPRAEPFGHIQAPTPLSQPWIIIIITSMITFLALLLFKALNQHQATGTTQTSCLSHSLLPGVCLLPASPRATTRGCCLPASPLRSPQELARSCCFQNCCLAVEVGWSSASALFLI